MQFEDIIKDFSVKSLLESEVEITGDVPYSTLEKYREPALNVIAAELQLPGFRQGHVPPSLALQKVGEMAVLEDALDLCVRELYPELVVAKELDVVGRPEVRITKLAPGNPASVTIRTTVYPTVTVPKHWLSIGQETPEEAVTDVTEEEITQTLEALRKQRAHKHEDGAEHLPEIDDDFARSIGAFRDLSHLKEEIAKSLAEGKLRETKDKRRGTIIERLVEKTEVIVPRLFVESELEKIMGRMKDDVTRMGASFEEYLKHIKKTEEDIRKEFRDDAEKRAKIQLMLNELARIQKIEADEKVVEQEMEEALKHFPDANRNALRVHVETLMRNEAVLKLLEGTEQKIEEQK